MKMVSKLIDEVSGGELVKSRLDEPTMFDSKEMSRVVQGGKYLEVAR